jgi:peptide/nickel transport system substrate-binding protein
MAWRLVVAGLISALVVASIFVLLNRIATLGGRSGGALSGSKTLTAICDISGAYTPHTSPFDPSVNCGIDGLVYENLVYVNDVTGQQTPMLASALPTFSSDNLTLTFTIRQSVKWSDGQAFDANDVAFTFNMLKQYPSADPGVWGSLSSVTASGPNTVVMKFSSPAPTLLPTIEGVYIVPKHIWSTVGDPTKITDINPVGTGPMKLSSFSPQLITYVKNSAYWQANKVKVEELEYPVVGSAVAAILKMSSGAADWTSVFDSAVNVEFLQKDKAHNFSSPVPVVPVQIAPNLKNPLLGQLVVRKAISAALDRQKMSDSDEEGFEPPSSPTGLVPGQEAYLDPKYNGKLPQFGAADPNAATQLLQGAGFTKGGDGVFADAQGRRLSFKVTVPSDFSDYVADLETAQQNLKAAGIDLQLNKVSVGDWVSDRQSHNFDLIMTDGYSGPTPYYYLAPLLHRSSANNWEQWNDPTTDQLLDQYTSTSDPAVQKQAIARLANIMVDQLPVIPVLDAVQFYEYSTKHWVGWPTPQNLYAVGSAYQLAAGDNEQVILHLTPA